MKLTEKELDEFNSLCNLKVKVGYFNPKTRGYSTLEEVPLSYYYIVKQLRDMNEEQLKSLFYDVGLKQVIKICRISTDISFISIIEDDLSNENYQWRIIIERMLNNTI